MSKADPWTHCKIRQRTADRLAALASRIVELVERGIIRDPGVNSDVRSPTASGMSVDAIINLLLDRRDAHNRRARNARARRSVVRRESQERGEQGQ